MVDYEEREQKLDALLKPLWGGATTATLVGMMCVVMMVDPFFSWNTIAIVATSGLVLAAGLSLWGLVRITSAARSVQ